jgi:hypothetical protein
MGRLYLAWTVDHSHLPLRTRTKPLPKEKPILPKVPVESVNEHDEMVLLLPPPENAHQWYKTPMTLTLISSFLPTYKEGL